jgi:hypothetical protein
MPNRKGAKKVSSSKSSAASKSAPKRAKTGKYAKASKSSASASSSSRGYNYIPNSQIKSITTVDDKVITKKKILDGAYVRKKNGGMMKSPKYDYELFKKIFTKDEQERILNALRGNSRKKKFDGKSYYLLSSDKIFFTKSERDEMVEKLRKCGFTVRTVDASGVSYATDKTKKYLIWIQFDSMA